MNIHIQTKLYWTKKTRMLVCFYGQIADKGGKGEGADPPEYYGGDPTDVIGDILAISHITCGEKWGTHPSSPQGCPQDLDA